jgi:hypothetical protein
MGHRVVYRDGGLVLCDGRFIAVEMKYPMNWLKACQAGWQFEKFLVSAEGRYRYPRNGIVFFDALGGDGRALLETLHVEGRTGIQGIPYWPGALFAYI